MKRVGLLVAVCLLSLLHSCIAHEYHDPLACSWMKNATFKAGTELSSLSEDQLRAFVKEEMVSHVPAKYSKCSYQLSRHACFQVFNSKFGIQDVDPRHYFPSLSYDRTTTAIGNPLRQEPTTGKRVAYLLLVHKNVDQLKRLIRALYHPDNVFIIHADAKFTEYDQLKEYVLQNSNMFIVSTRFDIMWGGIDMVLATLEGLFTALDIGSWDYIVNLSGADYPLCTDYEFKSRLGANNNYDMTFRLWEDNFRLRAVCLVCEGVDHWTGAEKGGLDGVTLYGSSQWFIYHRSFVEYLRSAPIARVILAYIESSCIPDEEYFATVLMNSPYATTNDRNNMRYILFESTGDHPISLSVKDMNTLRSVYVNQVCFARKFAANDEVLNVIDEWRYNKTQHQHQQQP